MLVEYELVHVRMWNRKIDEVQRCLDSTLIVRHPDSRKLLVNYDHRITELMKEIDIMGSMGIDVPPKARVIRNKREELKENYNTVKVREIRF